MAAAAPSYLPIAEISAYNRTWTIKARVTAKSNVRNFRNGQGKVFDATLLDAMGGEIRASFFNQAADKYGSMIENGKCYTFAKGVAKVANKQYNPTNHRYELTFDNAAEVVPVSDDTQIETVKFSFKTLKTVQMQSLPCQADLCGIVTSFKAIQTVQSKEGQELTKRDITIVDDSAMSMTVTLWGDRAKQEDKIFENQPLVAIKGVLVKEWREGRSGSILSSGVLQFAPQFPEAQRVQQWWKQSGSTQEIKDLSQEGTGSFDGARARAATATNLSGMKKASERMTGQQPETYSVVARLALVQTRKQGEVQPLHYMACQEPREGTRGLLCQKRVDEAGFCPSCNRNTKALPRLNLRCRFVDYEDQAWLTSFHEAATKILGKSGEDVRAMELAAAEKGEGGREELDNSIRACYFDQPFNLIVRAKLDSWQGEMRSNISVVDAKPVSKRDHARQMLKEIHASLSTLSQAGA